MSRPVAFFIRLAAGRRAPWIAVAIALLIALPAVRSGYACDDDYHRLFLEGVRLPGGPRGAWDLYRFAGDPDGLRVAIDRGIYPWWTNPSLRLAFFRPIASLWRAADHALWGASATMPHLESALIYGLLALITARFFQRIFSGSKSLSIVAGLAGWIFAADASHGMAVSWVANRYTVLATLFAVTSLELHVRSRASEARRLSLALGSALVFGCAMLTGEVSLGTWGYLVSYALFMDGGSVRARVLALAPHAVVTIAWAIPYRLLGCGASGSGFYVDPLASPGLFLKLFGLRFPLLVLGKLLGPPAELWAVTDPRGYVAAAVALSVGGALAFVLYRVTRDEPRARFFGLGALLAIVPTCAVLPADRNLFIASIGAAGVLALAFARLLETPTMIATRALRWVLGGLMVRHFLLAPVLFPLNGDSTMRLFQDFTERNARSLPHDPDVQGRSVVVLMTPDALFTNYGLLHNMLDPQRPAGASTRLLTVQTGGRMAITRTSDRTLSISNRAGINGGPFGPLYREAPFRAGERIRAGVLTAEVMEDDGALPTRLEFTFDEPLEAQRWVVWQGREFVEVPVLAVGESREFEVTPLMSAMMAY
ncbi:MAG: hypothetical protein U0271_22870 [Polyangiaceae bacterium]